MAVESRNMDSLKQKLYPGLPHCGGRLEREFAKNSIQPWRPVLVFYRIFISPLLIVMGGAGLEGCRFTPTCSHYAEISLARFGLFRGAYLSIKRILRCNPWSRAMPVDYPPERQSFAS